MSEITAIRPAIGDRIKGLEISDLNHRGEGVGRKAGFTLFVPQALPGEIVSAEIISVKKGYARASLLNLEKLSPRRAAPVCPNFGICGGCQLQHLDYSGQLAWKRQKVEQTLKRIGGLHTPVEPILGMAKPWAYRNKAQVRIGLDGDKVVVGFYQKETHRIIDLRECPLQYPLNFDIVNAVRLALQRDQAFNNHGDKHKLPFSTALVRSSFSANKGLVALKSPNRNIDRKRLNGLADLIYEHTGDRVSGIGHIQTGKKGDRFRVISGQPFLTEEIEPYRFRLSAQSFAQVNPLQAAVLYRQAVLLAASPAVAWDLYCGTGTLSVCLAKTAGEVIGIDSAKTAIKDAFINAALNRAENIRFINSRVEDVLTFLEQEKYPGAVVLNPPRQGCSVSLLRAMIKIRPERIVYISCNPATLARDLALLCTAAYRVVMVRPVDMFPHTSHVEVIALIMKV